MTYGEFVNKYNGKPVEYDNIYLYQCVDLAKAYLDEVYGIKPGAWGDAYAYWTATNPAILARFDKVANGPTNVPKQGDILVYSAALPGSGGAGHIEIFDRKTGPGQYVSFSQNWGGQTAHMVTHADNYKYVLGWLTPKPIVTVPQGGNMTLAEAKQVITGAYRGLFKREPDQGGLDNYANKLLAGQADFVFNDIGGSQELKNVVSAPLQGQLAQQQALINQLNQTVTDVNTQSNATKAQLQEAISKVATLTSELETANDKLKDAQNNPTEVVKEVNPSWLENAIQFVRKVLRIKE